MVPLDIFLRAFLNKATGSTTYQVYITVKYASDWLIVEQANYLVNGHLNSVATTKIGSDVDCYSSTLCIHREDVGFDIPVADLRWLAGTYEAGSNNGMPIRLKTHADQDINIVLMPAEAAGLLRKVDQYRADWKLPPDPAEKPVH